MAKMRNTNKTLVCKLERKTSHGRPRCRWEDNIRMDLREVGWEVVEWVHLAQEVLINTVMKLRVPYKVEIS
jgi:hypothetical protein